MKVLIWIYRQLVAADRAGLPRAMMAQADLRWGLGLLGWKRKKGYE